MNTNNNTLSNSLILAAVAAVVVASVGALAAVTAFSVVGVLAIFAADYRRSITPLRAVADVVPFEPRSRANPAMRRAA
jgi:hypothetical protein